MEQVKLDAKEIQSFFSTLPFVREYAIASPRPGDPVFQRPQ